MRRIAICGYKQSGKTVFLANLMRQLPPDSFYLAFAAPDGEWHWSNFGDQDLVAVVRQKGAFTTEFIDSMVEAIGKNEQPLVLVDTGGVQSAENERIFAGCDGVIILVDRHKYPNGISEWREFAARQGIAPIAELESDLHGSCELYADQGDGVVRGRISGLQRGATIQSPALDAVAARLKGIIRVNSAEMTDGELRCNINGATLLSRVGVEDANDPFLGIRPERLRPALRLTNAVAKLDVVRIWNVRAAILASAYAARIPGQVELYDVSKGYIQIPDVATMSTGHCPGIEWEVLPLPEYTVVKWKNTRFISQDDLRQLIAPGVNTTRPVIVVNDGPPMWLHATLVRAYVHAGVPWVAQFWPVESGRAQPSLGGKKWDEVHPFAGPAVIVAGPEEKVGEIIPISFDLLRWGAPQIGRLASGELVIDRKDSHVASHSSVMPLLTETLSRISSEKRDAFCDEVEFGRVVGETICVHTQSGDNIVFAQRPNRLGLTRFVKDRTAEPTTKVTACFKRTSGGGYLLMTAFVGGRAPAEPWDTKFADATSREFWSTHALVWGNEKTIPGTETNECPW